MADNNIDISLNLNDNGTFKKRNDEAKALNAELDKLSAKAPKAMSAAYSAPASVSSASEYGQYDIARSAGGTGAAGRDFAKQAQGLGGLVHVYATFAANLFAAETAFRALSDAMNTAHLVQGLDQLGAQSGKALGTLAKDLNRATDSALSMKEAMTSVAQASAAGLSNDQILKMGEVAKKASQALGWDMADAMDRLTKGIAKNRPQLLDELGILVNANTIYTEYARTIGKTSTTLTDFEKKQAFANAVIKQGLDKFSAIEIPTNPYTKLESSMANLAQTGLSLVNTVLGPIVEILSKSPVGLTAVLVTIGATLLNQALPALSAWRQELVKSAEVAAATAKNTYESFRDYSIAKHLGEEATRVAPIQRAMNDQIINAQTALAQTLSSKSKILTSAMSGSVDPTAMEKMISTELARRQTVFDKLKETKTTDTVADSAKLDAYNVILAKQQQEIINLQTAKALYGEIALKNEEILAIQAKTENRMGLEERARSILAARAQNVATSKGILAQVGADTQTKGAADAFANLRDNIKNGIPVFDEVGSVVSRSTAGLKGMAAATTLVKGSFLIMASTIGTAVSVLMPWLQAIGLAFTALGVLDSMMSNTTKEQESFNASIESGTAAVKVSSDALSYLADKSKKSFSIEGINAMSNAFNGLSDSINTQVKAYTDITNKQNVWDKGLDALWSTIGRGNLDKLKDQLSKEIPAALNTLVFSTNSAAQKVKIAEILKIDPKDISADSIKVALDKLSTTEAPNTIERLRVAMQGISDGEKKSTAALNAFAESLTVLDKEADIVNNKLQFKDGAGKLGVMLQDSSIKFSEAMNEPIKALEGLRKLATDTKALSFLPDNLATKLIDSSIEMKGLEDEYQKLLKAVADADAKLNKPKGIKDLISGGSAESAASIRSSRDEAQKQLEAQQEKIKSFNASQVDLISDMYKEGARQIAIGLKDAIEKASLTKMQSDLDISSAAGLDVVKEGLSLRLKQLEMDKAVIQSAYENQKIQLLLGERLEKLDATLQVTNSQHKLDIAKASGPLGNIAGAQAELDKAKRTELILEIQKILREGGSWAFTQASAKIAAAAKGDTNNKGIDVSGVMESAQKGNQVFSRLKIQEEAASAAIDAQIYAAHNKAAVDAINEINKKAKEYLQIQASIIANQSTYINLTDKVGNFYSESALAQKESLQDLQAQNIYLQEQSDIEKERSTLSLATDKSAKAAQEEFDRRTKNLDDRSKASTDKYNLSLTTSELTKQLGVRQQAYVIEQSNLVISKAQSEAKLEIDQASLSYQKDRGLLSTDELATKQKIIDLAKIETTYAQGLAASEAEKKKALDDIKILKALDTQGKLTDILSDKEKEVNRQYEARNKQLDITANKSKTVLDWTQKDSERMTNFTSVMEKGFQGMGDALYEFAKTGKMTFGDLIQSMIDDLIKFELRAQTSALYRALGGGAGIATSIGDSMGLNVSGQRAAANDTAGLEAAWANYTPVKQAKGGAWEHGIQAFAKGGMFTNSIVNKPTIFPFAQGTGLMGEAGPEAIMPLTRDGQGNLGVRSGSQNNSTGNVEVVINNYSSEKATANETTDSKGNRKIEVIVGDMVASEIKRSGSATQTALKGSFGATPALVRR